MKRTDDVPAVGYQTNLENIMDELARIDIILRNLMEKWRKSGENSEFLGLYISDKEIDSLLAKKYGVSENLFEIQTIERQIAEKKKQPYAKVRN